MVFVTTRSFTNGPAIWYINDAIIVVIKATIYTPLFNPDVLSPICFEIILPTNCATYTIANDTTPHPMFDIFLAAIKTDDLSSSSSVINEIIPHNGTSVAVKTTPHTKYDTDAHKTIKKFIFGLFWLLYVPLVKHNIVNTHIIGGVNNK